MDTNVRATPRAIVNGISDGSGVNITAIDEKIPGHLPLVFIMSEKGPDTIEFINNENYLKKYGVKTFVEGSEFFTHQTSLMQKFLKNGNAVMVKRIIPTEAKKAMIRLSLEVIPTTIPVYELYPNGEIIHDTINGVLTPRITDQIIGSRLVWHSGLADAVMEDLKELEFGEAKIIEAYRTASDRSVDNKVLSNLEGVTSRLYPIMDIELSDYGSFGNKFGIELLDVTAEGIDALNLMMDLSDFIYKVRVIELDDYGLAKRLIRTSNGEMNTLVTFSSDSYLSNGNYNYSIESVIADKYPQLNNIHLYKDNLTEVTYDLVNGYSKEGYDVLGELNNSYNNNDYLLNEGIINLIHGKDSQNQMYRTFTVDDSYKFLGIDLAKKPLMANGGSDGLLTTEAGTNNILANLEIFDGRVREYLTEWGSEDPLLNDPAKNPFTTIWDSGFSMGTKKAFIHPLKQRDDIWCVLSTFIEADYVGPPEIVKEPKRSWMTLQGYDDSVVIPESMPPLELPSANY